MESRAPKRRHGDSSEDTVTVMGEEEMKPMDVSPEDDPHQNERGDLDSPSGSLKRKHEQDSDEGDDTETEAEAMAASLEAAQDANMNNVANVDGTPLVTCPPLDQRFDSWEDFHRAMGAYLTATHQPMRLRTSDSARAVNSRAAKRNSTKVPIDESVGFVKKLYLCTHGVKTKPRGKGKRPRQHYRYRGCPAMIRASISERKADEGPGKSKYVVRVVAQINKHNHNLSEHLFKSYADNRVVIDEELGTQGNPYPPPESSMSAHPHLGPSMSSAMDHMPPGVNSGLDDQPFRATPLVQPTQDELDASRIKHKVGWIGTGIMGNSMCGHLIDQGYEVTVYNRTLSKCEHLRSKGAVVVDSPAAVAQVSDIVFVIVGYPSDVRTVVLDPHTGALPFMKKDSILVDMTTSEPSLAKEIDSAARSRGVKALDAPVSGGDVGARQGTLSIMIGGDVTAVYETMPLFSLMGKNIRHQGPAGAGQHTKMVNQILIATNMIGVVEGLLYAKRSGLDMNETIACVSAGAAGSWSISNLGPRIAKRDFNPGFIVEHFIKDMGIALTEAERMKLSLPGLALAKQLYVALQAQGQGRMGTQALMLALEQLNGMSTVDARSNLDLVDL